LNVKAVIPDLRITALCFSTAFPTSELPGQVRGVIPLTRYEIKQGKAGISQPTSSPSIFLLSIAIFLDCQQRFAEIIQNHEGFKSRNRYWDESFSYQSGRPFLFQGCTPNRAKRHYSVCALLPPHRTIFLHQSMARMRKISLHLMANLFKGRATRHFTVRGIEASIVSALDSVN
jgi:hypothetical protein